MDGRHQPRVPQIIGTQGLRQNKGPASAAPRPKDEPDVFKEFKVRARARRTIGIFWRLEAVKWPANRFDIESTCEQGNIGLPISAIGFPV